MYHIAVCDDNQEEAHLIGRMTQEIMAQREIEAQVDLFFDPESLLDKLQQTQIQYDLFLLDILMEERNGIQLAQALRQRGYQGKLIYITVSRDYAIDGYKVKADDYLLKPVEKDTLDQAIGRVLGGRDHTTIIHGAEKIAGDMAKDENLRSTIEILKKKINPQ